MATCQKNVLKRLQKLASFLRVAYSHIELMTVSNYPWSIFSSRLTIVTGVK